MRSVRFIIQNSVAVIVMLFIGLGLSALIIAYTGVATIRRWAERHQVLDIPSERSSHTRPTPRGGGLAIIGVTLGGLWVVFPFLQADASPLALGAYTLGAVLIAAVSWLDDLGSLPSRVRLGVHLLGALLILAAFGTWRILVIPVIGPVVLGWLGVPLTLLWIVGLTNAYNFMDGIDGIAGGQAVVAGLGWTMIGWLYGQPMAETLGLLMAASSLGFLVHNWSPARIFMGDVGSAFLGYTFAVLAVRAARSEPGLALAGAVLLWPFIFDTCFTFLRRLRRGENIFSAHRSHLYQRLVISGLSHSQVTILYLGLALVGVGVASLWLLGEPMGGIIGAIVIGLACLSLWGGALWREQRIARASSTARQVSERR